MRPLRFLPVVVGLLLGTSAAAASLEDVGLGHVEDRWSLESAASSPAGPWWAGLDDPHLDAVIKAALRDNLDLGAAEARVKQAKGIVLQQGGALMPSLTFDLSGSLSPLDALGFQFGGLPIAAGDDAPEVFKSGSAMFNAGWQVDLFGAQSAAFLAARHDVAASRADGDEAALQVSGLVAAAYFDVVAAESQLTVTERQLEDAEALLAVLDARFVGNDASALDVLQQRQQVATIRSRVPGLQAQLAGQRQQLRVLTGGHHPVDAPVADALPELGALPDLGQPSDLLDTRPDLAAAVLRHKAAQARSWSAVATGLPVVRVGANTGWQANKIMEVNTQSVWGANGTVTVPIFGGGRAIGTVQSARAAATSADYATQRAVLSAIAEVESSAARDVYGRAQLDAVRAQRLAAEQAYELARTDYLQGTTPFISVLQASSALQGSQLSEIQTARAALGARTQLLDALGRPTGSAGASTEVQP